MAKHKPDQRQPRVTIEGEVLRQIRQHARSNSKTEVCGVLIGEETNSGSNITARIPGLNAAQAGTYVTFTQDTWEQIYKVKDKEYPDARILGWYHSHPGFGVFLSDHDTFIHKNFFSSPMQLAWVYDPLSDEEGCFGWAGERIERLSEIRVKDDKGGEEAGETGKPEPVSGIEDQGLQISEDNQSSEIEPPAWLKWLLTIASHLLLAAVAFMAAWFFLPRIVPIFFIVDPVRGSLIPTPPGTHLSVDDSLVIPGVGAFHVVRPDRDSPKGPSSPFPGSEPQLAPPSSAGTDAGMDSKDPKSQKDQKDQNAPRK